jgi:hypothetical protein
LDNEIILAKEIEDCSACPLYGYDCVGGYTTNGCGTPIEPPCCSWNGDEEIIRGMYENNPYEPSKAELQREREYLERKQLEKEEEAKKNRKEELVRKVNELSKFGNAKTRKGFGLGDEWYCPHCNRWFKSSLESWYGGIGKTYCNRCGNTLAHAPELDE